MKNKIVHACVCRFQENGQQRMKVGKLLTNIFQTMNKKKGNKTKDVLGTSLRRSELDDELMRDNMRSSNRLRTQLHYQDRAHRVIMKDLGKESYLLQNKLGIDRRDDPLRLSGYQIGTSSQPPRRNYSASLLTGKTPPNGSVKHTTSNSSFSKTETKFPWDSSQGDTEATAEKDNLLSNVSPLHESKSSSRLDDLLARYPSSKAESDDFLTAVKKEAVQDEILYTKSAARLSSNAASQADPKASRRRKTKSSVDKSCSTSDSIVNALNVM